MPWRQWPGSAAAASLLEELPAACPSRLPADTSTSRPSDPLQASPSSNAKQPAEPLEERSPADRSLLASCGPARQRTRVTPSSGAQAEPGHSAAPAAALPASLEGAGAGLWRDPWREGEQSPVFPGSHARGCWYSQGAAGRAYRPRPATPCQGQGQGPNGTPIAGEIGKWVDTGTYWLATSAGGEPYIAAVHTAPKTRSQPPTPADDGDNSSQAANPGGQQRFDWRGFPMHRYEPHDIAAPEDLSKDERAAARSESSSLHSAPIDDASASMLAAPSSTGICAPEANTAAACMESKAGASPENTAAGPARRV
jgi:hypothetical protein